MSWSPFDNDKLSELMKHSWSWRGSMDFNAGTPSTPGEAASDVDWNENDPNSPAYIKNRTHWEEVSSGTLLAERSPDMIEDGVAIYAYPCLSIDPSPGVTYTVKYNGTTYTCVGIDPSIIGGLSGGVIIGNIDGLMGTGDTGEPFIIALNSETVGAEEGVGAMVMLLDGSTELIMSIDYNGTIVHKLDRKYMNLAGLATTDAYQSDLNDVYAYMRENYYGKYEINNMIYRSYVYAHSVSMNGKSDTGKLSVSGAKGLEIVIAINNATVAMKFGLELYDADNNFIMSNIIEETVEVSKNAIININAS